MFQRKPNYKTLITCLALPLGLSLLACDGDTTDPATAGVSDLNPPGDVVTVTKSGAIELRWSAANVEDNFKGYYVFGIKKSDYDAKAKSKAKYPTGANPEVAGVPRCKDNSAFFEAFGLPKTEADCEGAPETTTPATSAALAEDTAAATEKLTGFLSCTEKPGLTPSLPGTKPVVTTQRCTVSQLADKTALANGTTYAFIVVAVADDDFSTISWSSKVIFDTPSATALATQNISVPSETIYKINLDVGKATLGAAGTCTTDLCGALSLKNAQSAATSDIYISRSNTGTYKQRLYISAPAGGSVIIQPRGPQTWDPIDKKVAAESRIPGDAAAKEFPPTEVGTKYIVYNNQVFDLQMTKAGLKYYGKVYIGDVTYATATDINSAATVSVTVVMQPGPGITHYGLERAEVR